MPPKNPNPFLQSETMGKSNQPAEIRIPFPSDRKGMKKSKAEEKLARDFQERLVLSSSSSAAAAVWREKSNASAPEGKMEDRSSGRERLKRHRVEVAGRVWIPEMWGQETFLKDWIDCTAFDSALRNNTIMSARAALVEEGKRANSNRFRIENSC